MFFQNVGDEFEPITVSKATLQAMEPSAVVICRWPLPLRYQFYRNLLPDLQITLCNSCNKVRTVGFEAFMAVTMKNASFWDVAPCENWCFRGMCCLHLDGIKIALAAVLGQGFSTLKMEATRSSKTSVPTRTTCRHIQEDCILFMPSLYKVNHLECWWKMNDYIAKFFFKF
jgi:hypothetical protein